MNKIEKEMLEILQRLKQRDALAVKAEFEAEGTRSEELLRLLDIARKANMKIALKVGGCEAVKDLIEAKQYGVDYIIAPMVETSYALEKFVHAKNKVFLPEEQEDVIFLVNLETETAFKNFNSFKEVAQLPGSIDGFVFGRVDYVGSMKYHPDHVDDEFVLNDCLKISKECKEIKKDFIVGGGISNRAIPNLVKINDIFLSRFETRKIVFSNKALESKDITDALLDAVHFELLWLMNKKEYYGQITREDNKRYQMLNNRWKLFKESNLG